MRRFVLRYMFVPVFTLWICFAVIGSATASDPVSTSYSATDLIAGLCLALPTLIVAWLGVRLSRWLHERFHWDSIPYVVANVFVAIAIVGIGISLSVAMIDSKTETTPQDTVAVLLFLVGFLGAVGWLIRSLWKLAFDRANKYTGLHWRLIAPNSAATHFVDNDMRGPLHGQSKSGRNIMPSEKPMRRDKSPSSIFRPVSVSDTGSGDMRGVPIPKRIGQQQTSTQRASTSTQRHTDFSAPTFHVYVSYSSPYSSFIEQAQKYVNFTAQEAEHVPFMQYWPTYESMTKAQQRWYFYWRTQLRQGNPLSADTSYLFVYVYEVLNLVGFSSPEAAFRRLAGFWKHYRVLQPKLDNYLVDWLADFLVVYKLSISPLKWYGVALQEGALSLDIDLSVEAWLKASGDFQKLPTKLLYKLANYIPTRSKFFKSYGDEYQLESEYLHGLRAIEQYLRDHGSSLFKIYQPSQTRVIQRQPFASALHDLPQRNITLGTVHPWASREDLSVTLASIIKYSENLKRTQAGFSSKLRGIELPDEWQEVLDTAFAIAKPRREITIDMDKVVKLQQDSNELRERLLAQGKTSSPIEQEVIDRSEPDEAQKQPHREVSIDMSEVARLQGKSEDIRARMNTDDQSLSPQVTHSRSPLSDQQEETAESPAAHGYTQRPVDAPAGSLTDLPEVAEVMGKAGQTPSRILRFLKENDWEVAAGSLPRDLYEGSFLNTELDAINNRAARVLGDALIFEEDSRLVVAEDYRVEIEFILDHPDYAEVSTTGSSSADSSNTYSDLTEDWAAFAQKMQPSHWEILAALLLGVEVEVRLSAIARSVFSSAFQLVDEMNEFAMDSIGDIVVDTEADVPHIEEEDMEGIRALLAWASQKLLLEGWNE